MAEWVLLFFANYLFDVVKTKINEYKEKKEREKTNKENVRKYLEAIDNGLSREEQIKRAENMLNGVPPAKHD